MLRKILKKSAKILLWIVGILLALLLLVFLLLQIPAVQQRVAREVVTIANKSLNGGELGIGYLDLDFPSRLELDDVYLNNPEGDSIARVGHLGVGINMLGLLSSTVEISDVVLQDVYAHAVTTDSTSNIQFLLDLGATDSTTVETTPPTATDTTSSGGFAIDVAGATFLLERADLYYQDDPAGLLADVNAVRLAAKLEDIDLENQAYAINYLELDEADAKVGLGESTAPTDTTATAAANMLLSAGRVTIRESDFALDMAELNIGTTLPYVNLEGAELALGEQVRFNGELFQLRDLALNYDTPAPPLAGPGLDYNHIGLTNVQAEATEIAYVVDSLHLKLRQLAAVEKSGLEIQRTEGTVIYDPSFLGLEGFLLRTQNTELKSGNTAVRYDFAGGGDLAGMVARTDLNGFLGLGDVALLAPDLLSTPVIKDNLGQRVRFDVRASGTLANLKLTRVHLFGPGVQLRAIGRVENVTDMERIAGQLTLQEFSVVPGPLLPLVPEGMLPPDIDWPEKIVAEGSAEYRNDRLRMNFYAVENREFGNGMRSRVRTNGVISGLKTFPNASLNVELDTLLATKPTILAYLPPGTLPEDYSIPDFVRGSGTVSGPMDDLDVNLRLNLPGEETYASINGNIRNALDPDNLNLDLAVSDLSVKIADVQSILPPGTLPDNLNLPDLRIRNARISGSLDNLDFDVPLETDNGVWNIAGRYNPKDLDLRVEVEDVRLADLFTGPLSDTLKTLELGALNVSADVKGQLEPSMNLLVDARIGNDKVGQFADLNATVADGAYAADFDFTHPDFLATGEGSYAIGPDSVAKVDAVINLQRVDLQQWDITEEPMIVVGGVRAEATGLDPYALEAMVRFDTVQLRGAEGSSYVDSLLVTASLQDQNNEIYVFSDVLEAELLGVFDPVKTPEKMVQFIMAYWEEDLRQPVPVEDGESLDFALQLKRPQPLTGGLLNGLRELSPFNASLLYRDASPELLVNLDLPEIDYAGVEATGLKFRAIGDLDALSWEANWDDINYNDQAELGRTVLTGETMNDEMLVELKLYTENDSLRHYLGFVTDPESDTITVRLEEEQILNFETWTVPASNLIALSGPSLIIQNVALSNGEQRLRAETTEPGDVVISFGDFNLRTPSRLIFSEEEVAAGIVNGTVGLDNVLTNLGIRSNLSVDRLTWEGTLLGDIVAEVTSNDEQVYQVDVAVTEAGNNATVTGTVELDGPINLVADLKRLQLQAAEPFSLGYLNESEGYLSGTIKVGGTLEVPDLDGSVRFNDASLIISLLGERFRLDDKPIRLRDSRISFGDDWNVYDSRGGSAQVRGYVEMRSVSDIALNLRVNASDFMAINSTEKDNKDWYGQMYVDASVDITGTALRPVVDINATTSRESEVTYVYRILGQGLVETENILEFTEEYRWRDVLRRDTLAADTNTVASAGMDLTLDLRVDPELAVTVVVDPVTGQTFTGKANGDLTMRIYPDGRQEATGRVELVEGKYDFILQVINKEFEVLPGSSVTFTGDLLNPELDLRIRHRVNTAPLPLVQGVMGEGATVSGLSRSQTFFVDVTLKGDLQASNITTNVVYPQDAYGNLGLGVVNDALSTLRQDESRMTTTAFQLLAFGSFNIPLVDSGSGGGPNLATTTLNNAVSGYLNNVANELLGFVDLDFGLNSYQDEGGQTQTNLRVSLRKTLFDDRVVISVDGVAGTAEDELAGTQQTYLDNITAEYLINEDGSFRLKFFNDRDRNTLVGGNVVRFGGRLTFGKDFDRIRWFGGGKEKDDKGE